MIIIIIIIIIIGVIKKENLLASGFSVTVDHWAKIKENEKNDNTYSLPENEKYLWNIKMTGITIVIRVLVTFHKGLVNGLEEVEIEGWDRPIVYFPETWRNLLSLWLKWKLLLVWKTSNR